MKEFPEAQELAFPPEVWTVELVDGGTIEVLTHGFEIKDGYYVFSLLFKGSPLVDIPVLKIPASRIAANQWP